MKNTYIYTLILITMFYTSTQAARANATFATCNEANKTGTGMRCAGAMPNSFLLGNTFMNNYHGFTMSNNAIIGEQYRMVQGTKYPSDNRWQGNFNSRSMAASNVNPDKNLSPFNTRDINSGSAFNPNFGVAQQNAIMVMKLVENPPLKCDKIDHPGIKKGISQQIAKKQIPLSDTASIITRMQVFEALKQNYTWQPDTILAQFADSMQLTTYRSLQLIDSVMFDTSQCNATLLNACQNIVAFNHVEQHIQTVSEIYISSQVNNNGVYSPQQISDLENIAWLCPFEDGKGVYLARFLLQEVNDTEYLNSCEEANGNNLRIFGSEEENEIAFEAIASKESINVYPNPANESIHIESSGKQPLHIDLFDMVGRKVLTHYSVNQHTSLNIANMPTGLYIIKIRSGDVEEIGKINIQH